jgi:hypothetical protein
MPTIKPDSLILAIQIVNEEIKDLKAIPKKQLTDDIMFALQECEKAAEDFKEAYTELEKDAANYPPYYQLIGPDEE